MFQKIKSVFLAGLPAIVIATLLVVAIIYAWTEPTSAPPAGNVSAPINAGPIGQSKQGNLMLNTDGTLANGLLVPYGNVGIGTTEPEAKLDVNGAMIFRAVSQPAVSSPNQAVIYLDPTTKDLKVSINGQSYVILTSGAAAPSQVTNLSATPGNSQVSLSWSAPTDNGRAITDYKVYRSISSGSEIYLTNVGSAATSFTDTALTGGTYYYKVSAINAIGEGVKSAEVSATPPLPLTYPGSTHNEVLCTEGGGIIVTDGTYTFCKYTATDCPATWIQAASWQRYTIATWGGDSCGGNISSGPTTWSNTAAIQKYNCGAGFGPVNCGDCLYNQWSKWYDVGPPSIYCSNVCTIGNPSTNRVEIGCH
ncbi:fibronectin type III domain-containing protein [Patescibacteria group bacterium]|nr:fibronectin type III domain-containing protein [Patescibacteria group bacterium]